MIDSVYLLYKNENENKIFVVYIFLGLRNKNLILVGIENQVLTCELSILLY